MPNAIDLLVEQHRELERQLATLFHAGPNERAAALTSAADLLMSHVTIEEQHFYPAVHARRTEDILLESLEEHLSLKRIVADLIALDVSDVHFEPKSHVLKEQAEHHHREEEEHLFPKVRKLLDEAHLQTLGAQMQATQASLLAHEARTLATEETKEAAPLG
jgi:hemerythrin superfamily protein